MHDRAKACTTLTVTDAASVAIPWYLRLTARTAAPLLFASSAILLRFRGIGAAYWLLRYVPSRSSSRHWTAAHARLLSEYVDSALPFVNHPSRCLSRSLALTLLLRSLGMPATLVLGIRPVPLKGHAWVELGATVVNDDARVNQYYRRLNAL